MSKKKPTRSQREAMRVLKAANARAEARGHTKKTTTTKGTKR